jgi:hypothetical protein
MPADGWSEDDSDITDCNQPAMLRYQEGSALLPRAAGWQNQSSALCTYPSLLPILEF